MASECLTHWTTWAEWPIVTDRVACSVDQSVCHTTLVSPAKMAVPIKMHLG